MFGGSRNDSASRYCKSAYNYHGSTPTDAWYATLYIYPSLQRHSYKAITFLDGHYLNLPVLDAGMVVGMVDVLKLTYATLELASIGVLSVNKHKVHPFIGLTLFY